jgi:hypothetical protein
LFTFIIEARKDLSSSFFAFFHISIYAEFMQKEVFCL